MGAALIGGLTYFTLVFAAGFALGTARVILLAPLLGPIGAVLFELPLMLAISWLACGWTVKRFSVPNDLGTRLAMGGIAFACLMAAELGVSVFAFGRSLAEHVATYRETGAQLGLAAQIAFALFPLVRRGSGPG